MKAGWRVGNRAVLGAALVVLAGCGKGGAASSANVHTYHMRGVVVQLPKAGVADRALIVHHEAVPGFVDMNGKVVGMMSMTMPFTLASDVKLDGIAPGDKIAFTLVFNWDKNSSQVTELTKLPADTVLDLPKMTMGQAASAPARAPAASNP